MKDRRDTGALQSAPHPRHFRERGARGPDPRGDDRAFYGTDNGVEARRGGFSFGRDDDDKPVYGGDAYGRERQQRDEIAPPDDPTPLSFIRSRR